MSELNPVWLIQLDVCDVSAYELKVAPVTGGNGVKMADVSLDGQDIVLDVYNKTGDARISATAFINGTEVAKREFGVNISEYVILPEKSQIQVVMKSTLK